MTRLIRLLRFTLKLCLRLLALAVVLLIAALAFVGLTGKGARFAADRVASLASKPGQIITIGQPSGLLTGALRVPEITIADGKGPYLILRDLSVDWSPFALLGGTFRAQSISADQILLSRKPEPEPAPQVEDNPAPFRLPVALDIATLSLPEITLGQALTGKPVSLALDASGRADEGQMIVRLDALRKDMPDARVKADIAFVPDQNRLTLSLTVDEPKNGLIADLLELPGRPAVHISADGEGPLSNWSGTLSADLDGTPTFSAKARHQALADKERRIILTGNGNAEKLLPPLLRPLFAGATRLEIDAAIASTGRVEIAKGLLSSAALNVDVSGAYDPAGDNDLSARISGVNGPLNISLPSGDKTAALMLQSATLSLKGPAHAAALSLDAKAPEADYPGHQLKGLSLAARASAFDLGARTGPVDLAFSFEEGRFDDENLQRLLPGPMDIKLPLLISPEAIRLEKATVESARLGGTLNAAYDVTAKTAAADVSLFALPDILPPALAAKAKDRIALAASLGYGADGTVSLSNLALKSDLVALSGTVSLTGKDISADIKGTLPSLSNLLADANGQAAFTLAAEGPLAAPAFKAELHSQEAVLSGRSLETLSLRAEGKADPKAPEATLAATGKLGGQTIDIRADITTDKGVIALPVLKAEIGKNRIEGALTLSPAFLPSGDLRFSLPDIGLLAALAGEKAAGDLSGEARFNTENGISSARIKAGGKGISRQDLKITAPSVALDIADLKALSASGTIEAAEIVSGANRLTKLALRFDRVDGATRFDLKAGYDGKPLVVKGSASQKADTLQIALQDMSAAPKGVPLALAKPSLIEIRNGVTSLSGLVIRAGKGSVTLSGTAGQALKLAVELKALPLALANSLSPGLGAEGTLSGTINVSGSSKNPDIAYRLALENAAVAASKGAGLTPLAIKADGKLSGGMVNVNATAANADGLQVKGGGTAGLSGARALNLTITGSLPFKALSPVLSAQGLDMGGTASLNVKVAGTASAPVITGQIRSSDAKLTDVRRNLALRNLQIAVDLDRSRARISSLSGTLSTGGTVSVSGTVGILPGSGFPADLAVKLDKAAYVDGKVVSTVADGTITLSGPLTGGAKLSGRVSLGRSAITVPQKLPASLAKINVQHRNESVEVSNQNKAVMERQGAGKKSSSSAIALDLVVSAPRIFVQGRGIDAELGGDLTLRGTASDPVVSGGFKMVRGRMTILSRRLDFTTGTISFGGDLTPTLDMKATTDSDSRAIIVSVEGSANDPAISFSSNPSLPQDEVLAQLIFRQSMSRLSVLQIAQLADAAAQLAGGRSTSLLQGLQSNLGVDDLDVTSDETGQAKVKAGKYLNDRTYIQVEQGSNSGSKASINLDVGRGIKLKGEAGSDGAGAAGIYYEKEY